MSTCVPGRNEHGSRYTEDRLADGQDRKYGRRRWWIRFEGRALKVVCVHVSACSCSHQASCLCSSLVIALCNPRPFEDGLDRFCSRSYELC
jgi:hypothetical protein